MVDAPEKIWAYHNGNSQTYLTVPNKFHSVEYTRSDLVAELAAENERLLNALDGYGKLDAELAIAERRIEALSRTGAVKVKALAGIGQYHLDNWTDDDFRKHIPAVRAALSDAIARLSALEPTPPEAGALKNEQSAPEGQQEPVAWQWRQRSVCKTSGRKGDWSAWIGGRSPSLRDTNYETEERPLYTRPSEQAVTEAWQPIKSAPKDATVILYANKFGEIGFCYWSKAGGPFDESMWWDDQADDECCPVVWLPANTLPPLKSAMEAGRHD